MLRSYGTLRYDPTMKGQKVRESYWMILTCDEEITRYYAWLLLKQHCVTLRRPAWRTHVSVIRNERIKTPSKWGWGNGKKVEFQYDPTVLTNGIHYWMRVTCDKMLELREWYGLPRTPYRPLHLTLGNDALVDGTLVDATPSS